VLNIVGDAMSSAEADMSRVQTAADAIGTAIGKVQPWLGGDTWTGPAATSWEGDWSSFYATVQGVLNSLPSAESSVISGVQKQAEALQKQLAKDQATAAAS
jgi:uncharacterized protein YukE